MVKIFNCPICDKGELQINIPANTEIAFSGKFKDLDSKVFCQNCKRQIRYRLVKKESQE